MTYDEVLKAARECIGDSCKACSICNGMGCRNRIPGPRGWGIRPSVIIRNGRRSV